MKRSMARKDRMREKPKMLPSERATRWPLLRLTLGIGQMAWGGCGMWLFVKTGASSATLSCFVVATAMSATSLYVFRDPWWSKR